MFFFILDYTREIYYVYADVLCAAYPMKNIDTIMDDGRIDRKSALHFAVYGVFTYLIYTYIIRSYNIFYFFLIKETDDHLKILDGLLHNLLYKKWHSFIKKRFYFELIFFTIFYILCSISLLLKREYHNKLVANNCPIAAYIKPIWISTVIIT